MKHKCVECNRQDVRLYRPYGEFLRESRIACNAHMPTKRTALDWWVPLCENTDGSVWGYTSVPDDAIQRWTALPDTDPAGPTWRDSGWVK